MIYKISRRLLVASVAGITLLLLGGCCAFCNDPVLKKDIVYAWDIPQSQADCPTGTEYRTEATDETGEQSPGTGIIDRSGGTGIIDRDGDAVEHHCYRPCASGETAVGPTIIDWQNDGDFVVAYQICAIPGGGNDCPAIDSDDTGGGKEQ